MIAYDMILTGRVLKTGTKTSSFCLLPAAGWGCGPATPHHVVETSVKVANFVDPAPVSYHVQGDEVEAFTGAGMLHAFIHHVQSFFYSMVHHLVENVCVAIDAFR